MTSINKVLIRPVWPIVCFFTLTAGVAHAQASGNFSIHAVIPDNQIDKKQTYFDLRMQPGDEQEVEVVITNSSDHELVAEVRLNAASTGRNGVIVYTAPDVRDEIMKVSIKDVASIQTERVRVPAHGSKSVTVDIKMPGESSSGVILGGIAVTGAEAANNAQAAQGVSLANKITYVIALKLTEGDGEAAADFDLTSVTPELVNFRTAVVAKLQNKAARIVKGMKLKAGVFREGSDTALQELVLDDVEMAPLSSGVFAIDWRNQPLNQGTYLLKMTADYDGRTWEWDKTFTIGTEAGSINSGAVGLVKNYTWYYVLAGAIVLTVVWFAAYRSGKRMKPGKRPHA